MPSTAQGSVLWASLQQSLHHSPPPAGKTCFLLPLVLWKLFPYLVCCRSQTRVTQAALAPTLTVKIKAQSS